VLRVLLLCLPSFWAHFLATPLLPSECAICMTGEVCLDLIETQEDCMQSYSRISVVFFRGKRIFNVFYCIVLGWTMSLAKGDVPHFPVNLFP